MEVIARVAPQRLQTRFLALSVSDEPDDVISVIRAGARGYVTKTISTLELADAVRRVADGDAVFSPRLAGFVLDAFAGAASRSDPQPGRATSAAPDADLDHLTERERDVLRLVCLGLANKQIAVRLGIGVSTVKTHLSSVYQQIGVSDRTSAALWARTHLDPDPAGGEGSTASS